MPNIGAPAFWTVVFVTRAQPSPHSDVRLPSFGEVRCTQPNKSVSWTWRCGATPCLRLCSVYGALPPSFPSTLDSIVTIWTQLRMRARISHMRAQRRQQPGWSRRGRSWSPPQPPFFQHPPPQKERSPSALACSTPARSGLRAPSPCVAGSFAVGACGCAKTSRGTPRWTRDIAVLPAVNNPALKQPEVVCLQIPEDGAESVIAHDVHWGDLAITSPASRSSA
jgi:hypothetical protein